MIKKNVAKIAKQTSVGKRRRNTTKCSNTKRQGTQIMKNSFETYTTLKA